MVDLPWITNEIKRSMRKQDRLFCRARKSNTNTDWSNIRKFKNSVAKSIISPHKNYINNIIGSIQNVSGHVLNKKEQAISVPKLKTGTKVCNSDIDKT